MVSVYSTLVCLDIGHVRDAIFVCVQVIESICIKFKAFKEVLYITKY